MFRQRDTLAAAALILLVGVCRGELHRVTADGLNVRSGPGTHYAVICQVNTGDRVDVKRVMGEWAEIVPPEDVGFWVYSELIVDGKVAASRVNLRAKPGINYRSMGKLEKGAAITVLGTEGDWTRIPPPKDASLWVSTEYLAPDRPAPKPAPQPAPKPAPKPAPEPAPKPAPEPAPKPAPKPAPEPAPKPAPKPAPMPAPKPVTGGTANDGAAGVVMDVGADDKAGPVVEIPSQLEGRRLDEDKAQGGAIELSGKLLKAGFTWGRLSKFRLVQVRQRRRPETACYILGNEKQLAEIVGRQIRITGKVYWVDRVRYPALLPDRIMLLPE